MQKKESQLLKKCLIIIEEQLQWGSSGQWHSNVFDELSELIANKTGVLLSPTTLKRVWGKVNYDNAPSISTLNTLAAFIGYLNWRDFKTKRKNTQGSKSNKPQTSNLRIIITSSALLTILFISLFSMIGLEESKTPADYSNVVFSSRPITKGYPNSVVFELGIANIESNSMYIQQYWDPSKTIKLKSGQSQATGIYYYPGHFRAKLIIDGTMIRQHDLFLKSEGWTSTIDYSPVPKYHNLSQSDITSALSFSDEFQTEVKNLDEPMYSTFHFVSDLGIVDGDNFKIASTIKSTYMDKWAICQTVYLYLLGTKGAIIIPFSKLGCVSDIDLMLNGPNVSGKEHDLSAFGVDLTDSQKISVSVKNKVVTVLIGGKEVYSDQYQGSMGELVGLRYKFLGLGEVSYISITPQ
jgi:hypothetical protein